MAEQFITATEIGEIQRLLRCLDGLKVVSPEGFKVFDQNGEELGWITMVDGPTWAFHYPDPDPVVATPGEGEPS